MHGKLSLPDRGLQRRRMAGLAVQEILLTGAQAKRTCAKSLNPPYTGESALKCHHTAGIAWRPVEPVVIIVLSDFTGLSQVFEHVTLAQDE